ncbi:hypothetical protein D7Y27_23320 [Corallococcus sp. AB004]|nr:hypothetical protein [Corallococcus exiguus]NRD47599.1 hypothetical protein [Corallococcus exiguus]RKH97210.1 hypothetical protein D7Y04_28835 [Corallococcus sp. AB038B]RKI38705.1 hypothetical protein D7Y27_23320 [Corallococcus sp. AB004]
MGRPMRAIRSWLALLIAGIALAGCAKHVDTRVAGDDDATIDGIEARLDELRAREQGDDLTCAEQCDVSTRTCATAKELCGLVEQQADRDDLPPRCARAREQCAGANDGCTRCQAP